MSMSPHRRVVALVASGLFEGVVALDGVSHPSDTGHSLVALCSGHATCCCASLPCGSTSTIIGRSALQRTAIDARSSRDDAAPCARELRGSDLFCCSSASPARSLRRQRQPSWRPGTPAPMASRTTPSASSIGAGSAAPRSRPEITELAERSTHARGAAPNAPTPLLEKDHPVDWWFAFKFNAATFPGCNADKACPFGGTPQRYPRGEGEQFAVASNEAPQLQMNAACIGEDGANDPVGATFEQVYGGSFFYVVWNDQFYDDPKIPGCSKSCDAPWGHSKGMLAWNDEGSGFVMQVTTPSWPASGSQSHPRSTDGNTLGCVDDDDVLVSQHFFALRLSHSDLAKVVAALTNASVVTDPHNAQIVHNGGPADISTLVAALGHKGSSAAATNETLSTGVILISKPSALHVPPWQMVSAVMGSAPLRAATWWESSNKLPSTTASTPVSWWDAHLGQPGAVEIATVGAWDHQSLGLKGGSCKNCNREDRDGNECRLQRPHLRGYEPGRFACGPLRRVAKRPWGPLLSRARCEAPRQRGRAASRRVRAAVATVAKAHRASRPAHARPAPSPSRVASDDERGTRRRRALPAGMPRGICDSGVREKVRPFRMSWSSRILTNTTILWGTVSLRPWRVLSFRFEPASVRRVRTPPSRSRGPPRAARRGTFGPSGGRFCFPRIPEGAPRGKTASTCRGAPRGPRRANEPPESGSNPPRQVLRESFQASTRTPQDSRLRNSARSVSAPSDAGGKVRDRQSNERARIVRPHRTNRSRALRRSLRQWNPRNHRRAYRRDRRTTRYRQHRPPCTAAGGSRRVRQCHDYLA